MAVLSIPSELADALEKIRRRCYKKPEQGESFMSDEKEKIACHVCKHEIPKSAALNAEGAEYVHYFCNTDCLDYWKKKDSEVKKEKD